uniref:Uncharacterized protein n=1 Tax=Rhizophora mucronata TaxID=61149 RepID=A0A2P2PCV4_RHIMU
MLIVERYADVLLPLDNDHSPCVLCSFTSLLLMASPPLFYFSIL